MDQVVEIVTVGIGAVLLPVFLKTQRHDDHHGMIVGRRLPGTKDMPGRQHGDVVRLETNRPHVAFGFHPALQIQSITGTSLTMTDASAPLLEVATCVTATCTLSGCTLTVPSGIIMYVMDDDQWSTTGAVGNLVLDNGTYTGLVKYDSGYTANVTVNSGAVWNLTADTSICALVNNGTINTNGYTLTYTSKSGSGTINETTGINSIKAANTDSPAYTIDGRQATSTYKGIIVKNGKKIVIK